LRRSRQCVARCWPITTGRLGSDQRRRRRALSLRARRLQGGVRAVVPGTEVDSSSRTAMRQHLRGRTRGRKEPDCRAVLAFFLGHWGIHNSIWQDQRRHRHAAARHAGWILIIPGSSTGLAFIEFVIYLTKSDQQFYQDYVAGTRRGFEARQMVRRPTAECVNNANGQGQWVEVEFQPA